MRVCFGPFAFDRQSRLLWRDGAEVALPPRVLGVLELLIDRAGQVVARQELLDAVWRDAFVTDTSLAEAVSFLRQALGDDPQSPRYIQTVHRRGYRFVAALSRSDPDPGPAAADRGLTPDPHFAAASQLRAVPATSEPVKPSIAWQLLPWSVAVLCAAAAMAAIWRLNAVQPTPDPPPIARFELRPASGTSFDTRAPALAVSGDGATLAWSACADDGSGCGLYVRRVDRMDAARLPGSDGAAAPFFSPDGRWIGFFADGKLKKIATAGGSPAILADAPFPGGATWSSSGWIAFAGLPAGGLALVDDQGNRSSALTSPRIERGELRHTNPVWLASGALLFVIASSPLTDAPGELAAVAPRAKEWKILRTGVTRAAAPGPGYLLLSDGSDLQVATFDERTLALTGSPDSVVASVTGGDGITHFAAGGGTLFAMQAPRGFRPVLWSDGRDAPAPANFSSMTFSPDGRRVAGTVVQGNSSDVWVADVVSGESRRLSYGGSNVSPAWTPDGAHVVFATRTTGPYALAMRREDQRDDVHVLPGSATHLFPSSVSSDGRIAVTTVVSGGRTAVALVPPGGGAPRVLDTGPFDERAAVFSPDGHWLALESDESGRTEIIARPVDGGRRLVVSTDGGTRPRWSADGRFLYYESGQRVIRAAIDLAANTIRTRDAVVERSTSRIAAIAASGHALLARPGAPDRGLVVVQWLRETRQWLPLPVTAPR